METRTNLVALLALSAGLAAPSLTMAQELIDPTDPIAKHALRRVYPVPGVTDAATGPDVIVGEIENSGAGDTTITPSSTQGGFVSYGLGTSSCNIGLAINGGQNLLWRSSTPYHPIIPQNMYRLKTVNGSTRLEQIGASWSKYAFTALTLNVCSLGCNNVGGSVLGMGCSDPYTASRNASQSTAGPRYQCNPFTGVFPDDGGSVRAAWPAVTDGSSRRLRVLPGDLLAASNPGALYFAECIYINRDDASFGNSKNNASYRRFTINQTNNNITLVGAQSNPNGTQRLKPAINAWRDNGNGIGLVDANVMITEVTCGNTFFTQPAYPYHTGGANAGSALVLPAGDGWVYVASKATDLGGGTWHYEYAVENLNSDRGIGSFQIDFPAGTVITNGSAEMKQVLCHSGLAAEDASRNAPWTQTIAGTNISWVSSNTYNAGTPQLGSYIRWGTMYNFRFDANVAPATGNASLGYYKPLAGYVNSINAAAHVPGTNPPPSCYANCDGSTGSPLLTANDFTCFINAYANGQTYANCDNSVGNPLLTANDFVCFINAFANNCS